MAIRHEHSQARPQPPRLKDLPAALTVGDRHRNRDANGRWIARNQGACGRGAKAVIGRTLGKNSTSNEVETVYREVRTLHGALMAAMPASDSVIQGLVSSQARSLVLSANLAMRAVDLGLETEAGRKALELSMKLDQRAERCAISAWDLACRLSANRPTAAADTPWIIETGTDEQTADPNI